MRRRASSQNRGKSLAAPISPLGSADVRFLLVFLVPGGRDGILDRRSTFILKGSAFNLNVAEGRTGAKIRRNGVALRARPYCFDLAPERHGGDLGGVRSEWRTRCEPDSHRLVTRAATLTVTPQGQAATLTVTAMGRSGERVVSNPAGISVSVGSTGSSSFTTGTSITLSVSNGRDALWSGACSSGGDKRRTCTFTVNSNAMVTANVQ
jgi:hypothetical protein